MRSLNKTRGMKMDKAKACEILNQAIAGIQTTRQGHQLLIEALNFLAKEHTPALKIEDPEKAQ